MTCADIEGIAGRGEVFADIEAPFAKEDGEANGRGGELGANEVFGVEGDLNDDLEVAIAADLSDGLLGEEQAGVEGDEGEVDEVFAGESGDDTSTDGTSDALDVSADEGGFEDETQGEFQRFFFGIEGGIGAFEREVIGEFEEDIRAFDGEGIDFLREGQGVSSPSERIHEGEAELVGVFDLEVEEASGADGSGTRVLATLGSLADVEFEGVGLASGEVESGDREKDSKKEEKTKGQKAKPSRGVHGLGSPADGLGAVDDPRGDKDQEFRAVVVIGVVFEEGAEDGDSAEEGDAVLA